MLDLVLERLKKAFDDVEKEGHKTVKKMIDSCTRVAKKFWDERDLDEAQDDDDNDNNDDNSTASNASHQSLNTHDDEENTNKVDIFDSDEILNECTGLVGI